MKHTLLKNTIMSALFISAAISCLPTLAEAQQPAQESIVHVTGYAQQQVVPDTALITVGAETTETDASEARQKNNLIMQQITNSLKNMGINKMDIRTNGFTVSPNYDNGKNRKIISYTVSNALRIKITDFDLISNVINTSETAGANQIYGVQFLTEHSDVVKDSLIKEAVQNGRRAAEAAALAAGGTLGKVKEINVSGNSPSYGSNFAMNSSLISVKRADYTPIESGSNTVSESVDITFYLQ
ncbi:MAG: SIMPL domain-containing protein [Megasphaera sp.]|jgi:uncharacterized protein YggE|uniref:SIMPL domain-containing protein n=1 Tax=Megasphaera sueciensis TaxID=349094 RepID=UPI002ACB123E|nr:SIMPL domain-containing protein [Megasphaera sp.]MCI1823813.1 SIMPL domain-containing protein [Megasphaera sp.]